MSASPIGEGCSPAATKPAICAISTISLDSTSSHICLNLVKSMVLV